MCAMRGSKHAGVLKPEVAHMPQNGMYAPPRAATEYQGWRIHRVFCDVCDEELQARRHSIAEAAHMPQNGMYAPPTDAEPT